MSKGEDGETLVVGKGHMTGEDERSKDCRGLTLTYHLC